MNRSSYWDIVKAIGIISIVIGHCCNFLIKFVYTYHLVIFFFVAGYFFNNVKYEKEPYQYIGNKLKATLPKYFCYLLFFILIHNILIKIGIYSNLITPYSLRDIFSQILNSTIFLGSEQLGGALWFVPVLVYSMICFCFIANVMTVFKQEKVRLIGLGIVSIMFGIFGIYLVLVDFRIIYHLQTIFLIMPIIYSGYLLRKIDLDKILKYLNIYVCVLAVVLILGILKLTGGQVDLAFSLIINPISFYPVSFLGIYFVMYLSKVILNIGKIKPLFSMIGVYSFDIMALHFLMFKIVDLVYSKLSNQSIYILGRFPTSNSDLWFVYILVGVIGPLLIYKGILYIKNKLLKKFKEVKFLNI